jgi:hypothetical protein
MKKSLILVALFALSACDRSETEEPQAPEEVTVAEVDPDADAGFEAVAPGDYEVQRADGSVDQLTVLPGMTWAMVFSDGEAAGGTIFAQGGKNCFVTEGVEGHQCFEGSEPDTDGVMRVTAEDGEVMTVRPVDSFD